MVAIRSYEADRYLANPPQHVFAYLIHGSDVGLVHERALGLFRFLGRAGDTSFSMTRLHGDEIAADPGRLADEINATGLFGGKRVVLVTAGSKNFFGSVEVVLADPSPESVLIIEAGLLRRDSPMRSMFERGRQTASIECTPDEAGDLSRLVRTEVQKAGLRISDAAVAEAVEHLGSDRAATRSEIEKLILYAINSTEIRTEDVQAVTADASALAVDAAISSAFLGTRSEVTETAVRAFETGNDPAVLLGFALRHASSLHRAKGSIQQGEPYEKALFGLLRGKKETQGIVRDQMNLWSAARLLRAIELVAGAIEQCRRQPRLAELVAVRTMWQVAQAARTADRS